MLAARDERGCVVFLGASLGDLTSYVDYVTPAMDELGGLKIYRY